MYDWKSIICIVEPIVGNMGCVPPMQGFLQQLRALCTKQKIVFILDEVITGFRIAPGGAQDLYNIKPDLTTLGKIIGGGLPVGAYGGKREIMKMVAPKGIYLLPSQFEAAFIFVAHTENNIERTVAATLTSLEEINR